MPKFRGQRYTLRHFRPVFRPRFYGKLDTIYPVSKLRSIYCLNCPFNVHWRHLLIFFLSHYVYRFVFLSFLFFLFFLFLFVCFITLNNYHNQTNKNEKKQKEKQKENRHAKKKIPCKRNHPFPPGIRVCSHYPLFILPRVSSLWKWLSEIWTVASLGLKTCTELFDTFNML